MKKLPAQESVVYGLMSRERRLPRRSTKEMGQFRVTWAQQIEADLIKSATLEPNRSFQDRGMGDWIVMMSHDTLRVEAPEEGAGEVRHLMRRMVTTEGKLRLPLVVDIM